MAVLAGILRKLLLGKSEKIRLIPLRICAVILLGLEAGKQIVSLKIGYDLYHLPLHFCSMFIFLVPLAAFYKGKYRQHILSFTSFICATLFVFMLVYPNSVYSEESIDLMFIDFLCFHKVAFHNVAIFAFLLILALGLYEPRAKFDYKNAAIALPCYYIIGGVMAQILKTNFNNFYYCTADAVDNVRLLIIESIGYPLGQTVYVIGASAVNLAFAFLSYPVCRFLHYLINERKSTR